MKAAGWPWLKDPRHHWQRELLPSEALIKKIMPDVPLCPQVSVIGTRRSAVGGPIGAEGPSRSVHSPSSGPIPGGSTVITASSSSPSIAQKCWNLVMFHWCSINGTSCPCAGPAIYPFSITVCSSTPIRTTRNPVRLVISAGTPPGKARPVQLESDLARSKNE
jgi:hypothetical protein